MNAASIISVFATLGIHARAVRCEVDDLAGLPMPAVLHWGMSHFVVLTAVRSGCYHIFDPARGHLRIKPDSMSEEFTGVAFELTRLPNFTRTKRADEFSIRRFAVITPDVKEALWLGATYSVFLQLFMVCSPFFIQIAVDEATTSTDIELIGVLALGFCMLAAFNFLAEQLRTRAMTKAANALSWNATRRLFRHMMMLPLAWFERRGLADISSRMDTMDSMKQALTGGLVSSALDGVLSVMIVVVMFLVSPVLALIGTTAALAYLLISWAATPYLNKFGGEMFHATLRERAARIETIRSIATIKSVGAELDREAEWSTRLAESVNAGTRQSSLLAGMSAVRTLLDHLGTAASVYVGVTLLLGHSLTVGALFAFFALKRQLSARLYTFVQQITAFRQTVVHADRLADIVLSDADADLSDAMEHPPLEGRVVASNVFYGYGQADSFSVKALNLVVQPGELALITGPSGSGKSTIMKLLAGLYRPYQGEIRYDGTSLSSAFSRSIRTQIGSVMQGDDLLAGSIAENVAFFAANTQPDRVWECLEASGLADDVRRMPLQLQTRIGEIGSSLSAGQRQRLLIARALYRKPAVLLLDEATANIDAEKERDIFQALRSLGITIVAVTHRSQLLEQATTVFVCANGTIVSASKGGASSLIQTRKAPLSPDRTTAPEGSVVPS